jgi:hypothetical protein
VRYHWVIRYHIIRIIISSIHPPLPTINKGGWCVDEPSCKARLSSPLASSKSWQAQDTLSGIFSPVDTQFANVNTIYVKYCTSDAWFGDNDTPFGSSLSFPYHGRAVIDALFTSLVRDQGMGGGARVLFGGCSAGARGALFNLARVSTTLLALPGGVVSWVGGLLDSAFWIDMQPLDNAAMPFATQVQDAWALFNASAPGVVGASCAAAYSGDNAWKCLMGQYAFQYIDEPFFQHSYQYDLFQLSEDVGHEPSTPTELAYAEKFRNITRTAAETDVILPAKKDTGGLYPACYHHCNTMGSTFSTAHTNGKTLEESVVDWWFNGVQTFSMENCRGFKCGTECPV